MSEHTERHSPDKVCDGCEPPVPVTAELDRIRSLHAGIETQGDLRWDGPGQARRALYTPDGTPILQCSVLMYPEPHWAAFIAAAPSTVTHLLAIIDKVGQIAASMDRIADFNLSVLPSDDMGISLKQHAEDLRAAITKESA